VDSGRALADEQFLGDPAVGMALDQESKDLALTGRETVIVGRGLVG
jgi:nucleoside recognition membrane protein YjiH